MTAKRARKYPGDYTPKNIVEAAKRDSPAVRAFAKSLRLPAKTAPTPHYDAARDYLKPFIGGPYEREVWDIFDEFRKVPEGRYELVERAAKGQTPPLTVEEYCCMAALKALKAHVKQSPRLMAVLEAKKTTVEAGTDTTEDENAIFMSPQALFERLRVPSTKRVAAKKALDRARVEHDIADEDWEEITDRKPREPLYKYCLSAARRILKKYLPA